MAADKKVAAVADDTYAKLAAPFDEVFQDTRGGLDRKSVV